MVELHEPRLDYRATDMEWSLGGGKSDSRAGGGAAEPLSSAFTPSGPWLDWAALRHPAAAGNDEVARGNAGRACDMSTTTAPCCNRPRGHRTPPAGRFFCGRPPTTGSAPPLAPPHPESPPPNPRLTSQSHHLGPAVVRTRRSRGHTHTSTH